MDATCKTCPFRVATNQRKEDGTYEIRCRNVASVDAFETTFQREDFWCSEHPLRQRDRLAAMAMQGAEAGNVESENYGVLDPDGVARRAYAIADAMLRAARDPEGGERTPAGSAGPEAKETT